jgi:hypothetical protein
VIARTVVVVMRPRALVWDVLAERTSALAELLPHIEEAELKSRRASGRGVVRCEHVWRARPNVPPLLAPHIDRKLLEWTTRTAWSRRDFSGRWTVYPTSMKGAALCDGTIRMVPAVGGQATRVELELLVHRPLVSAGWHSIASAILAAHFRKLIGAAGRLAGQDGG